MDHIAEMAARYLRSGDICKHFVQERILDLRVLEQVLPLSAYVALHEPLLSEIAALGSVVVYAVVGWIDQAVFDVDFAVEGDLTQLPIVAQRLDAYRPAQNGDLAMIISDCDWKRLLMISVSFDESQVSVSVLRRVTATPQQ